MTEVALVASLFIGLALGLLGGGGSTLAVPLLIYIVGLSDKQAIATSLVIVAATSVVASLGHARAGNVNLGGALLFAPASMAGAYGGGLLAQFVPGRVLIGLFAVMMFVTAWAMWRSRAETASPTAVRSRNRWLSLPLGLLVGLVTGLVGAGGGFLVVPALALLAGMPMRMAIGTSLLVIAANSTTAMLGYIRHVSLDMRLALALTIAASVGALAGSYLAPKVRVQLLRRSFSLLVMVMGCVLVARALRTVWA